MSKFKFRTAQLMLSIMSLVALVVVSGASLSSNPRTPMAGRSGDQPGRPDRCHESPPPRARSSVLRCGRAGRDGVARDVGAGDVGRFRQPRAIDLRPRCPLCVLIGELFRSSCRAARETERVTVSVMFSFALLLGVGLVPARGGPTRRLDRAGPHGPQAVVAGRLQHRSVQLSLAAAAGVLVVRWNLRRAPPPTALDRLTSSPVLGAAAAYFTVNLLLVTRATTLYHGISFRQALESDLTFGLSVGAVLLCLAPVVVTVLQFSPILFPLLLVPLVGVYISGRQSVRTATAEHLARHDSLTELPNRRWFLESVGATLQNPAVKAGGLLLVDLNGFKDVNDTLGHHHGDLVLQELGPRLRASFRTEDLVARLGGDEFAVFMPGADISVAQAAVQRLQDALETPVDIDGISIALGASIGLAWYPDTARTSLPCCSARTSPCTGPRPATTRWSSIAPRTTTTARSG